ncbi:MAG: polysaccharide deacetylase family protein [Methyloceanibacter sp.]
MGRLIGVALTGFVAAAAAASGFFAASAQERSLLDRCWTREALAGTAGELKPSRTHAKLDLKALKAMALPAIPPVSPELRGSIRSVTLPPGQKLIALTFDLCEADGLAAGYDGRVVDLLRAERVKATFFAGGKWLATHEERAAQLLADSNFEIGSHGFRHRDMARLGGEALRDEIRLTSAAYARAREALLARQCASPGAPGPNPPAQMSLMRFPYGRCSAAALAAVADEGQLAIQWDVVTGDPDPHRSAKAIAATILAKAHPGAIVVAHANGRGKRTAEALAIAIPKLKEEGYSFVTVSELLAAGTPVIAASCYLDHPRTKSRISRVSHAQRHKRPRLLGAAR